MDNTLDELIADLSKNAEVPDWVNSEAQKLIEAAGAVETPEWVNKEVQELYEAAKAAGVCKEAKS